MVGEDRKHEPEMPAQSQNPACQKQPPWWWDIAVNHLCGLRVGTNFSIISCFSEQQEEKYNTPVSNTLRKCQVAVQIWAKLRGYLGHICTYQRRPVYIVMFVNALFESHIIPPNDPSKYRDATTSIISKVYSPNIIMKCLGRALRFPGSRFIFLVMFSSS